MPRALWDAPFAVLAHSTTGPEPVFVYANAKGLELFECTWGELIGLPSRQSAAEEQQASPPACVLVAGDLRGTHGLPRPLDPAPSRAYGEAGWPGIPSSSLPPAPSIHPPTHPFPQVQDERTALLAAALEKGFVDNYEGDRRTLKGRAVHVSACTLFNVDAPSGEQGVVVACCVVCWWVWVGVGG